MVIVATLTTTVTVPLQLSLRLCTLTNKMPRQEPTVSTMQHSQKQVWYYTLQGEGLRGQVVMQVGEGSSSLAVSVQL